ncbi:hypothetical protein [Brenneria goodwinii]
MNAVTDIITVIPSYYSVTPANYSVIPANYFVIPAAVGGDLRLKL